MKFTKQARELLEDGFLSVDKEDVVKVVEEGLEQPSDAYFRDEELYVTHTLAFHTPAWGLTDDYIVDQVNYRSALSELEEYGAEAATVGHWTYSTFECIKVPLLTKKGKITAAAVMLADIELRLHDHPVLDEDLWIELENEVNDRAMDNAIEWEEQRREIEFTDEQKSQISGLYWERWGGYHETGYISDDEFQEVVDKVLSGDVQLHQEERLF